MSMGFDTATAVAWIGRAAKDIRADEARLTTLDAAIGDGDHGANLARGLDAAVAALADKPPATPGAALVTAGRALISKTGGASGPLYGTGLRRAGKALDEAVTTGVNDGGADVAALASALQAMLEGIQELGGAAEGDKTMVDALAPAVASFTEAASDGAELPAAARAAAEAAQAGLDATVAMRARKGRASYLGERSVGHEDPGAASVTLLLRALAEVTAS